MTLFASDTALMKARSATAVNPGKPGVNGLLSFLLVLAAMAVFSGTFQKAQAQQLSRGDYAQCAVYEGRKFIGYDSVCLAEKRAAIRYLERGSSRYTQPSVSRYPSLPYRCPYSANGGHGYNATFFLDGRPPLYSGTFDATFNGRPCMANPQYFGKGYY